MKTVDDIRPHGTVEVECGKCEWFFWLSALDPRLPGGPFECPSCFSNRTGDTFTKADET
jgi:hypothetical protein